MSHCIAAPAPLVPPWPSWTPIPFADRGVIIAGNPKSYVKAIKMYESVGVDQVMMITQTETIPHKKAMRSIEMFGKYVFPVFREGEKAKAAATA